MMKEEINIAIAEYCCWRNIKEIDYQPVGTDPYIDGPSQIWMGIHPESDSDSKEYEVIPDYCNDLNEMHEAEKILFTTNNWDACAYESALQKETTSWAWHSTAKQRAEAFLKTIGNWEEVDT